MGITAELFQVAQTRQQLCVSTKGADEMPPRSSSPFLAYMMLIGGVP